MSFTRIWDESSPADSEQVRYGAGRIRDFKSDTRERLLTWFPQISNINNDVAVAQTTPAAGKIPVAGSDGKLDSGWIPPYTPPQNDYLAIVSSNSGQTVSSGSGIMSFDYEIVDPHNQYDTTANKFTAVKYGMYKVTLSGSVTPYALVYPASGLMTYNIKKNGSTILNGGYLSISGNSTTYFVFGFTYTVYFNGNGDYIQISYTMDGCGAVFQAYRTLVVEFLYS